MDTDAPDADDAEESTVRPEDLDFSDDRRVVELDDRRYVVATAHSEAPSVPSDDGATTGSDGDADAAEGTDDDSTVERPDRAAVRSALIEYVESQDPRHGFVVVGSFDDRVERSEAFGDDLPAVFREFVNWYAANVDARTPPAEVLGILLLAADVPVQYPARALERLVSAHDLSTDDSIDDLLTAVREEGFRIPPASDSQNHD